MDQRLTLVRGKDYASRAATYNGKSLCAALKSLLLAPSISFAIFVVFVFCDIWANTDAAGIKATKLVGQSSGFCALIDSTDGLLRCWGYGASGRTIGETYDTEYGGFVRTPYPFSGLQGFSIRTSADEVCVIKGLDTVVCRYVENEGRLVEGEVKTYVFPSEGYNRAVKRIDCGQQTCCATLENYTAGLQSEVYCWSFISYTFGYVLEQAFPNSYLTLSVSEEITDLSVGSHRLACATTSLQRVFCWGFSFSALPTEITAFQALSTHVFAALSGNASMAFVDAGATLVRLGIVSETSVGLTSWSVFDFTAVPGFGSAVKQVAVSRRILCALSTTLQLSCANHMVGTSPSDGSYLGLGLTSATYLINLPGPVDLGPGVLVSSFALVSNPVGSDPSETICALDTQGQVRCFGSNAYGALGLGLPSSIIVGDEPREMGAALKPVDFFGCGPGRYEVETPLVATTSAPTPYLVPEVETECSFAGNVVITQASGVFARNRWVFTLLERAWAIIQHPSLSHSWCTALAPGFPTATLGPSAEVFSFRPSVSGFYTISATTQVWATYTDYVDGAAVFPAFALTAMPILVSKCGPGSTIIPVTCFDHSFGGRVLTLALNASETYIIDVRIFTNIAPLWTRTERMNFTISSTLDFRAAADYTWPSSERTFAFENETALHSPEFDGNMLLTSIGDYDQALLAASAYFTPPESGWYYFGCLGTGSTVTYPRLFWFFDVFASREIPQSFNRRKFSVKHDPVSISREENQDPPVFMFQGKEYVLQYAQYGITGLRRGLSTRCWYSLDAVTKPHPNMTCAPCINGITPGGQNIFLNHTVASVKGPGNCVAPQVTMWHPPWSYLNVTSFASMAKVPLFLKSSSPIYVALSNSYTPSWLASVDISSWSGGASSAAADAMSVTLEGRLFKGGVARLEVAIRISRCPHTVTSLDIPIVWWPTSKAHLIIPGSDMNKYMLTARLPITVKPQVTVTPLAFRYVLDENQTYDAQALSPPLEVELTTELNDNESGDFGLPLDTTDYRNLVTFEAISGCEGETEPDDFRSSTFITWSMPIRSQFGPGRNIEFDMKLKPNNGRATLRALKLGYVPPIDKSFVASCFRLHDFRGSPNPYRFHFCLDFFKESTYLTSYLYSGVPRSSLAFTVEEPWLIYAPPREIYTLSPLYLFRVNEATDVSLVATDPSYHVNVRYVWDTSSLVEIFAPDPPVADLADFQKFIPVGRCFNPVTNASICLGGSNFTALPGHAYLIQIAELGLPFQPALIHVATLYKVPLPNGETINPFVARRKTHCLTVQTTLSRVKQGLAVAKFSFSSSVTIDIVFRRPCPRGSYSASGTNEETCLACPINTYQENRGQSGCIPCPINRPFTRTTGAISSSRCLTPPGQYLANDTVKACPRGSNCSGEGFDIASLVLLKGYWRTGPSSIQIHKCLRQIYCVGGAFSESSSLGADGRRRLQQQESLTSPLCEANHTGVLCESCAPFTSRQGIEQLCLPCTDETASQDASRVAGTLFGVAISIIVAIAMIIFTCGRAVSFPSRDLESNALSDEERLDKGAVLSRSPGVFHAFSEIFIKVRVLVSLFQVIGSISIPFALYLPTFFEGLTRLYSLFTLDLALLFDFGCSVPSSQRFYVSLVVSSVMPLLVALMILVMHGLMVECRARKITAEHLFHRRNVVVTLMFLVMFVVYPAVSQTILSTFNCVTFDDGSQVLATAPAVSCLTDEYFRYRTFAAFMILLYVVGIPALQASILFVNREVIREAIKAEDARNVAASGSGDAPVAPELSRGEAGDLDKDGVADRAEALRFLWGPYKGNWIFWEIWEMIRKLLQTSILAFVAGGTALQVVYLLVVTIFAVTVVSWFAPYRRRGNTFLSMITLWIVFFVTFIVLLFQIEADVSLSETSKVFDTDALNQIIIVLVFVGPALVMAQVVYEFYDAETIRTTARTLSLTLRNTASAVCQGSGMPVISMVACKRCWRKQTSPSADNDAVVVVAADSFGDASNPQLRVPL